jgi:hypothetical protein
MRASVLDLFPAFYDERQTASAAVHVAHLDMQLIQDGTCFVHEAEAEIVACGGWSRRNKLDTGSGANEDDERLLDPATEAARVRAMFVRLDRHVHRPGPARAARKRRPPVRLSGPRPRAACPATTRCDYRNTVIKLDAPVVTFRRRPATQAD